MAGNAGSQRNDGGEQRQAGFADRFADEVVSDHRRDSRERLNAISQDVLDGAIAIHREFGPGLLESAYQRAMVVELRERGLKVDAEVQVDGEWRGQSIGLAFRADLIVERCVLVELKAAEQLTGLYRSQTRTYLKLLDFRLGLLINFNSVRLVDGYERILNRF